jgi:hypothetical protein
LLVWENFETTSLFRIFQNNIMPFLKKKSPVNNLKRGRSP